MPTTALMLAAVAYFYGIKNSPTLKAMLEAVRPVVVGLLLWTTYDMGLTVFKARSLGWTQAAATGWDKFLIAAVTFGLLTTTAINPAIVIGGAALLGWLIYR
jgi:chromate transporter